MKSRVTTEKSVTIVAANNSILVLEDTKNGNLYKLTRGMGSSVPHPVSGRGVERLLARIDDPTDALRTVSDSPKFRIENPNRTKHWAQVRIPTTN